ncbi:spore coat protein CotJB [Brevibacillus sp. M2.1A]|uniref:spore coat protein CotJB n=1 Tax=Brevibacillus TaxID=55080 RepID=UPI00156B58D4|nr:MULTISPECIES: spore coat protein CotJB [Brevibacillus]MBY0084596.1 spore coat protein CotJB [Brevibacillus brevis]MCC8435857.1 spore coat protein CotJB [Brevibacillus sp. M2.1A]MCE0449060.1 spore coat protein CotJB [Brevibacillus sp. AF8]MCM3142245.1 spore coat protein CotJB [Brevibacillus sp. MER 51]UKK98082.1 spore coat protein CotJB [Brevibacillus brevis]
MTAENRFGDEQYYALLEQLQAIDFVLVELNLYLDTHPTDQNALQQFNDLTEQRWVLANEYERLYGPLQNLGRSYSGYPWQWNDDPWPWQV